MVDVRPYQKSIFYPLVVAVVLPTVVGLIGLTVTTLSVRKSGGLLDNLQLESEHAFVQETSLGHLVSYCYSLMSSSFEPDHRVFHKKKAKEERQLLETCLGRLNESERARINESILAADSLSAALANEAFNSNVQRFARFANFIKGGLALSLSAQVAVSEFKDKASQQQGQINALRAVRSMEVYLALLLSVVFSLVATISYCRLVYKRLFLLSQEKAASNGQNIDELSFLHDRLATAYRDLVYLREQKLLLVQMIAHDLRSPLMAAQGSLILFEEVAGDFLPEEAFERSTEAQNDLASAYELANKFLVLESIESGQVSLDLRQVDLGKMIDEVAFEHRSLVRHKRLDITGPDQYDMATCDKVMIKTLLSCWLKWLISNAKPDSKLNFEIKELNGWLTVNFTCDGLKVTKEEQLKFFDGLNQSEAALLEDNSKLLEHFLFGLTQKIVKVHSGRLGIELGKPAGVTLWFALPIRLDSERSDKSQAQIGGKGGRASSTGFRLCFSSHLIRSGVLVAALPLFLQIGSYLFLSSSIGQLTQLEDRLITHMQMASEMNMLLLKAFQANSYLAFYTVTKNDLYKTQAEQAIKFLRTGIRLPEKSAEASQGARENWDNLNQFANAQALRVETRLKRIDSEDNNMVLGRIAWTVEIGAALNETLQKSLTREGQALAEAKKAQESTYRAVLAALGALGISNLCIGVLSLIFIRRRFRSRLQHVLVNAQRLPTGQELEPELIGSDELSDLDHRLHQTVLNLKEARLRRNAAVELISHAILQPLKAAERAIDELWTLSSEILGQTTTAAAHTRKNLLAARDNCKRLSLLCSDLLVFASEDAKLTLNIQPVNLDSLFDDVLAQISPVAAAKNVELKTAECKLIAPLDELRMHQVLTNLVANAIKFAPGGSSVQVSAAFNAAEQSVEIYVSDQAGGIDPEIIDGIFDKFKKASKQTNVAFGLGLAICKMVVESHGGSISAQNRDGGALFTMILPVNKGHQS